METEVDWILGMGFAQIPVDQATEVEKWVWRILLFQRIFESSPIKLRRPGSSA